MGPRSPCSWTSWKLVAAVRASARLWEGSGYNRRTQQGPFSAASQGVSSFSSCCQPRPGLLVLTTSHLTFQLVAGTLGKTKWGEGGLCVISSYWATPLSLPFPPVLFPPSFLMTVTEKLFPSHPPSIAAAWILDMVNIYYVQRNQIFYRKICLG